MGLDQYAYVALKEGSQSEYYRAEFGEDKSKHGTVSKPREIAYWRKHPNLQGWMEQLYIRKAQAAGRNIEADPNWVRGGFNGIELELTWQDLDELEQTILEGQLPPTQGFFFGNNSDEYYREHDLEFVRQARAELFSGLRVFYNSSW